MRVRNPAGPDGLPVTLVGGRQVPQGAEVSVPAELVPHDLLERGILVAVTDPPSVHTEPEPEPAESARPRTQRRTRNQGSEPTNQES